MATLGISDAEREAIERFERDVIQPSMAALVILDFWAEWCEPCKQLSPVLEKLVADYAAKGVKLVKIDVEQEKLIAAQFRVQSIPTVYAFYQGQPVADLTNYRTENQLKKVIDQLLAQLNVGGEADAAAAAAQPDIEPLMAMGEQILAEGDAARATSIFRQIRDMAPDDAEVAGGLVRALTAAGELPEAEGILAALPEDSSKHPAIARALAALELAAVPAVDTAPIEARVAADPDDHSARFELAGAKAASGDRDAAADALLEIVSRDRDWNDGAARQRFLQLLEAQGLEDPWARSQRRRLSALLFT
ncbi:MAG TPA: tetratricopeptide repeat protein [Sphingomicrobium sp.]|nr:tetratricopeptide repeat protein [Sphingomicrobium sp.]